MPPLGPARNSSMTQDTQKVPPHRPGTLGVDYDELGAEMAPNARVWHKYVEESDRMDKELVEGWNKTLDVILLFAALFSAISTAFVIESSKDLKPDYAELAAQALLVLSQRSLGLSPGSTSNVSTKNETESLPFAPSQSAIIVNTLWFASLSLSVAVSLVCILAKDWCYSFLVGRVGPVLAQGRLRQQRWDGIKRWRMGEVLSILPLLMHAALLLFAVGLSLYLWNINATVAMPVIVIASLVALFYVTITVLSSAIRFWPYTTAVARLTHPFWVALIRNRWMNALLGALIIVPIGLLELCKCHGGPQTLPTHQRGEKKVVSAGSETRSKIFQTFLRARNIVIQMVDNTQGAPPPQKLNTTEAETPMDDVTSAMLGWMITNCEDSRSVDLALQSLAGADPLCLPRWQLWQCSSVQLVLQRLHTCHNAVKVFGANGREPEYHRLLDTYSLYSRSLRLLINFVRGEGLIHRAGPRVLENSDDTPRLALASSRGQIESFDNEFSASLIYTLRGSQSMIERCLDQSVDRVDLAAFEFDQPLFPNTGGHFENFVRGSLRLEQSQRKWTLLRRLVKSDGQDMLPPAPLLSLINGITKSYIYEPYQRPFLLVDLLRMLPPESHALRQAIGVCLAVVAFRHCDFPTEEGNPTQVPLDIGYKQARARQMYLDIVSRAMEPLQTNSWLKFGLLGLLSKETSVFHPGEDELGSIGDVLQSLTEIRSYGNIIPTLPGNFGCEEHVSQILSNWIDSGNITSDSSSDDAAPQLSCLINSSVSFPGACRILGTQIIQPLIRMFMSTKSSKLQVLCLQGIRCSAEPNDTRIGQPYGPYFEEYPIESALVCQRLGQKFLGHLFNMTISGDQPSAIEPYVMRFLWSMTSLILHCQSHFPALVPSLSSLLTVLYKVPARPDVVSNICDMGFTELWIARLVDMSSHDPLRLVNSQVLDDMISSYNRRAPSMRPSPDLFAAALVHHKPSVAHNNQTPAADAYPTWITVLRTLKQRCKENMLEQNTLSQYGNHNHEARMESASTNGVNQQESAGSAGNNATPNLPSPLGG